MIIFYICLIILGLLNFILKEWCTISRGAKPHAQKANLEKVLKSVAHTNGWKWVELARPISSHLCYLLIDIP